MQLHLNNSVVVVVGGASGIGRASAEAFAAEGASVVIWDIAENVGEVAGSLDRSTGQRVDISSEDAVNAAVEQTQREVGPIDILVHAAAVGSGRFGFPFTNLSPSDWAHVLNINIQGMVNVAHAVAPELVKRGSGSMVFVASVAGQIGSPTDPPYSASKAANINFAQVMAKDLATSNVRVNTVCPGMVRTPLNRSVWKSWNDRQSAADQLSYDDWAAQKIAQLVPLGRWQRPEDVANMIVFLSSEKDW